jgi:hypothetical protein
MTHSADSLIRNVMEVFSVDSEVERIHRHDSSTLCKERIVILRSSCV